MLQYPIKIDAEEVFSDLLIVSTRSEIFVHIGVQKLEIQFKMHTHTHIMISRIKKKTSYSRAARQINHNFIPFIFETFGASGPSFDVFLKTLANKYQRLISWNSSTDIDDKSAVLRCWSGSYINLPSKAKCKVDHI